MTRDQMREILADELTKAALDEKLAPPHMIEAIRKGEHGPGIEGALRAMERAADQAVTEHLQRNAEIALTAEKGE